MTSSRRAFSFCARGAAVAVVVEGAVRGGDALKLPPTPI